jgi:hypothetical protein
MNRGNAVHQVNSIKRFAVLKGLQARLRYQRFKFESFLRMHSHLKMNILDKIPLELNISRLPLSF